MDISVLVFAFSYNKGTEGKPVKTESKITSTIEKGEPPLQSRRQQWQQMVDSSCICCSMMEQVTQRARW